MNGKARGNTAALFVSKSFWARGGSSMGCSFLGSHYYVQSVSIPQHTQGRAVFHMSRHHPRLNETNTHERRLVCPLGPVSCTGQSCQSCEPEGSVSFRISSHSSATRPRWARSDGLPPLRWQCLVRPPKQGCSRSPAAASGMAGRVIPRWCLPSLRILPLQALCTG